MFNREDTMRETIIYKAYAANKRMVIRHRCFNERDEFAVSITGGKWNVHTLYAPNLGDRIHFMRGEVMHRHPRAAWHVIVDDTARFHAIA